MRLPQHFGNSNPFDVEVQLRVVLQTLRVVGVQRVVGGQAANEGVEQLVLAEGEPFGRVVDGEGGVVLEKAGFDLAEGGLLIFFIVRVVGVALGKGNGEPERGRGSLRAYNLAVDGPIRVVLAKVIVC
jgi:hypothetical protein